MRSFEKLVVIVMVIVFVTALGLGVFDVYVQGFVAGSNIILEITKHSTEALIAIAALVAAVLTMGNSKRGRKKRR